MRNHPNINKWMYSKGNISEKSHFDFIQKLESDREMLYFLVKKKHDIIGSINFSNIAKKESAELGIYSNPFNKNKGLGEILIEVVLQFACEKLDLNKIYLEVYSDNDRAINFYNKCGFKSTKVIENERVIFMEKVLLCENE